MSSSTQTDEIVKILFARDPPPPLCPGKTLYRPELMEKISNLRENKYVIAALHLANDDIHHAHLIAQDNEGDSTADLLHATLHRREGDYWNSKYWWSHISSHPTMKSSSDAKAFVDDCERYQGKNNDKEMVLRERQWKELKELVNWTRENCH